MVTVAIANVLESSKQALEFIYETSKTNGLKLQRISPKQSVLYVHNKKVPLKHYIEEIEKENTCDLLIVELSKEAMRKQLYEHLDFNIAVLFEAYEQKQKNKRIHVSQQLIRHMKAKYYVLPDRYKNRMAQSITYGWSKGAHISATSAQTTVDGQMELQCCVGQTISTMKGDTVPLKEFGIASTCHSIEGILAGVATLVLYGIDLDEYNKN